MVWRIKDDLVSTNWWVAVRGWVVEDTDHFITILCLIFVGIPQKLWLCVYIHADYINLSPYYPVSLSTVHASFLPLPQMRAFAKRSECCSRWSFGVSRSHVVKLGETWTITLANHTINHDGGIIICHERPCANAVCFTFKKNDATGPRSTSSIWPWQTSPEPSFHHYSIINHHQPALNQQSSMPCFLINRCEPSSNISCQYWPWSIINQSTIYQACVNPY